MPYDLVIVANRLPVDRAELDDGTTGWRRSPGGLVSAIEPVMRANEGVWIGWAGGTEQDLAPFEDDGMSLVPLAMSEAEIAGHYEGFSNGTLWPLYHDLVAKPEFHREWWDAYVGVNRRFAAKAAELASEGATVWVHDYQLQLVPQMLRELRPDLRIGFYLHIPFPPPELFQQLPWRRQILEGLLGADLVGFQLTGAAQNFVRLVRQRVGHKTHRDLVYLPDGRTVRAAAFPISIDAAGYQALAQTPEVVARSEEIREALGNPRKVFLGIDRLDYTKGIVARLHSSYPREEMAALYRMADIMVVTPYRDGMNLVAKEYVACRHENDGALVLSEFAGAAEELRQAWLVNPYDINGMKSALLEAFRAQPKELTKRMRAMRKTVQKHDVAAWADSFMTELGDVRSEHGKPVKPAHRS